MENTLNNKWARGVIPALLVSCSIGSVYAWSLFVQPLADKFESSNAEIQFAFSLAIFFLGMSAAFAGKFVEHHIRLATIVSTICFAFGLLTTALAIRQESLILLYLGYGVLMGIGLGIGYISPVKTLMLWFIHHKGLATGIAITGFGIASTIASPIITYLQNKVSLEETFIWLSVIYFIPMALASILIKKPEWYEEKEHGSHRQILRMFLDKRFLAIWIMIYINITSGLALISIASPLAIENGATTIFAATVVGIMGIFNGAGRLVYSSASDYLKNRNQIYLLIFILSIFSVSIAAVLQSSVMVTIMLCIISSTYGAGFSCLPSLLADKFGMDKISSIHGLALTAWAFAGLSGNQLSTWIHDKTGSYTNVLYVLIILYAIGLLMTYVLIQSDRKQEGTKAA
ncbi:MAG TPA: OFA family MFS transporter [Firmicutes bacterium]|nr:OFA family MFS transporter [Bacillota bacterium]